MTTYDYDAMGNLRGVIQPNTDVITYVVDANGRRVRKFVNGTPVQGFLYRDRLRVVAELDGQNNVVSRFVYADGEGSEEMAVANALTRLGIYTSRPTPGGPGKNVPAYMVRMSDGAVFRILADHLGTPRRVVNVATGEVAQALDFDAWGVNTQDTAPGMQPFGFAGGLWDRDTGLVRFGARDYDAGVGMWTATDPMKLRRTGSNVYAYAFGNPVAFVDVTGEIADPACVAACEVARISCVQSCNLLTEPRSLFVCRAGCWLAGGFCIAGCEIGVAQGACPPDGGSGGAGGGDNGGGGSEGAGGGSIGGH